MYQLQIKRIYEAKAASDGQRILVDRLWPRGVSKERAALDAWWKEAAPSPDLCKWFDHRADRLHEFSQAYREELDQSELASSYKVECRQMLEEGPVTLLYAAKDPLVNHARVLQAWLQQ